MSLGAYNITKIMHYHIQAFLLPRVMEVAKHTIYTANPLRKHYEPLVKIVLRFSKSKDFCFDHAQFFEDDPNKLKQEFR